MGNAVSSLINDPRKIASVAMVGLVLSTQCLPAAADNLPKSLVNVSHLGSFSLWFGVQFWATFVAGLTMFSVLPRPWFGKTLHTLFNKYFTGGIVIHGVMLSTYIMQNPIISWKGETLYLGTGLMISSLCTCLNGIYVEPVTYSLANEMYDYESKNGYGDHIGAITSKDLLENPTYKQMRKNFFNMHGLANIVHITTLGVSGMHLWFLSKKM